MVDKLSITKIDNVHIRIDAEPHIKQELSEYFTFEVPGAKFTPAYRNKMWDGKIRLYNTMTGLLYGGLFSHVIKFSDERKYEYDLDTSLTYVDKQITDTFGYDLADRYESKFSPRDYQNEALVTALRNRRQLLQVPTGGGKSLIAYLITRYMIEKGNRVLVIVPTTSLVHQMRSDFIDYNHGKTDNLPSIHCITGGVEKSNEADIVISTWQSIVKLPREWYDSFNCIIGDEAHTFKAKSLTNIMTKTVNCQYKFGMTGTLDGTPTHALVLTGLFGSVKKVTTTKKLIENKTLSDFIIRVPILDYDDETRKLVKSYTYQQEMDYIVTNKSRNKFICNLALDLPGNTLVMFQYVDKHGKVLYDMMKDNDKKPVLYVDGSVQALQREEYRQLAEKTTGNILLCSYPTFQAGINIKNLDNIIFASPSKSKIRNLQSIGRVLRKNDGKDRATLYDIVDDLKWKSHKNFAVKHFAERIKIYNEEGFELKIYPAIKIKG